MPDSLADQVYRFKCQIVLKAYMDSRAATKKGNALTLSGGVITVAARSLGIHRNTFMIWLKRAREMGDE